MLPQGLTQIVLTYLNVNTLVRLPLTVPLVRREIKHRPPVAVILALYPKFSPEYKELIYDGWTLELVQQYPSKIGTDHQLFNLCRNPDVDVDIIRAYVCTLDWYQLSTHFRWDLSTLSEFEGRIKWGSIGYNPYFTPEMLEKYQHRVNWRNLSTNYIHFTCELLEQYIDCIDWYPLSYNKHLTIDIIDRYHDKLDWDAISRYFTLPSLLLDRHRNRVHWREFSRNKHLTLKDVERCLSEVHWPAIGASTMDPQVLLKYCPGNIPYECFSWESSATLPFTDAFLERFQHYLDWILVSGNQSLTSTMIRTWSKRLHWNNLSYKRCVTIDFLEEFIDKIDFMELSCNPYLILGPVVNDRERALNFIHTHREKWNWCELSYLFLRYQWEVILDYPEWPWVWK